jgi:hypothetical protein
LRLALEKSINKSPHHYLAKTLFHQHINIDEHQFIGFITSHFKSDVLTSFHLHSFVTFYTDLEIKTVVTCMLTSRHHILLNMQDCLLQLVQLMQFGKNQSFLLVLTNKFVGSEVILSHDSLNGYQALGFDVQALGGDVSTSKQNMMEDEFTIHTDMPICIVQFSDAFMWSKYSSHLFPSDVLASLT